MRTYKRLTLICGIMAMFSLVICLFLHYGYPFRGTDFWIDVCLAVFGSALLTTLSSLLTYFYEKRSTLEGFRYHCNQLLFVLSKYQEITTVEDKMKFFIDYLDIDKSGWDAAYGNMDFFFERFTSNRKYIYEKIYFPILRFNHAVMFRAWHFRLYFSRGGTRLSVMERFIGELEDYLLHRQVIKTPTDYDDAGNPTSFCVGTYVEPKLTREIDRELDGRYYDITYGKKASRRITQQMTNTSD